MALVLLHLADDVEERLERLAARTGRTKTFYMTEAIIRHLDDLEDIYLADKSLEDIRSGKTKTIPLEDVICELGLED